MDLSLKGQRTLITGSSRGIGAGIALEFLSEGARVAITGRDANALMECSNQFKQEYEADSVLPIACDLTKLDGIEEARTTIVQQWSGIDILILNLGSGASMPGLAADHSEWLRVLELNLVSGMQTLRTFSELLERGKNPAVVAVGSIAGIEALGAPIAYGAAKAGLSHAMKSASRLLAPRGIRVNLVAPGNIYFSGGTWDRKQRENPAATAAMLEDHVPMRRFGQVEDVAAAVAFLASSRAAFITGSCLVVDGGQTRIPF